MHTILIIEDDSLMRDLYASAFGQQADRCTAIILPRAEEALKDLPQLKPDIILTDMMMPGMSGLDLLVALKKSPATAGIPVLMLTNLLNDDDASRAREQGAKGYLIKSELSPHEVVERTLAFLEPDNQDPH